MLQQPKLQISNFEVFLWNQFSNNSASTRELHSYRFAGRQLLKFSGRFAIKRFLRIFFTNFLGNEFFKRPSKLKKIVHSHSEINSKSDKGISLS